LRLDRVRQKDARRRKEGWSAKSSFVQTRNKQEEDLDGRRCAEGEVRLSVTMEHKGEGEGETITNN
jgi:hypothetical protein